MGDNESTVTDFDANVTKSDKMYLLTFANITRILYLKNIMS